MLAGSMDNSGISLAHGAKSAGPLTVDLRSRPTSARVLCDLRPVTPSLGLGIHICPLGGPVGHSPPSLPPPLGI